MPTRFIHSMSLVMPVSVTLPLVQCHHVRGLADSGGVRKPCASGSAALWAKAALVAASASVAGIVNKAVLRERVIVFSGRSMRRAAQTMGQGLLFRVELRFKELNVDVVVGGDHSVAAIVHVVVQAIAAERNLGRRPYLRFRTCGC